MLRFAIVGCGVMGTHHARNAAAHAECSVELVVDRDDARARKLAEEIGIKRYYTSFEPALDSEVDAIVLAIPHSLHHRYATEALRAGKHVMIEKPISLDLAEAEDMVRTARETGKVLLVGHVLRFYPANEIVHRIAHSGQVGNLIQARYHAEHKTDISSRPWMASRQEGGIILGGAIHHTDILCWWCGKVDHVRAYGRSVTPLYRKTGMHDHALIIHEFANGAIGESCYSLATASDRLPYTEAMLTFEHCVVVLNHGVNEVMLHTEVPVLDWPPGTHRIPAESNWSGGLRREMDGFVRAIHGEPPQITPEEAMYAVKVALKAKQSADALPQGQRVPV